MPGKNLPSAQTPADFRSQGALKTFVFATDLIAAKPVKPCDRAVFGAFYSLLKKERNMPSDGVWKGLLAAGAASRALVWRRMGLLRLKRGIAWAHCLGALLRRSRRAHRLGSQPGQTVKRQTARSGATKPGHARLSLPHTLRKPSLISLPV